MDTTAIDSLRRALLTARRLLRHEYPEKAAACVDDAAGYAEIVGEELDRANTRVLELERRLIDAGQEISAMASESQQATAMLMAAGEHAARLRSERDDLERRLSVLLERQAEGAHTAHAEGAIPAEVAEVIARACEPWRRDGGIGGGTR